MSKSTYKELCEQIATKVQGSARPEQGKRAAVMTSRSDLVAMTHGLLNSPDHEVKLYDKKVADAGEPTFTAQQPAQKYRDSLKPVMKAMGIDKDDMGKLDDVVFPKEHAAAVMDLATTVIHDYMKAGRRFVFPLYTTDESQMGISTVDVEKKVTMPNRFEEVDGRKVPVPTGNTVTTDEHRNIKATNRVPYWLRTTDKN